MKKFFLICFLLLCLSLELSSQYRTVQYRYDNLNRLVMVNYGNGVTTKYNYDVLGNRISQETTVLPLQINVTNKSVCQGQPVELGTFDSEHNPITVTGGSGDYDIMWYPSSGLLNPSSQNPTVVNPQYSGNYTINVYDRVTTEYQSGTMYLNVLQPATVSLPSFISVSRGNNVNLSDRLNVFNGTQPYTYFWTDKNGWTLVIRNPIVLAQTTTRYFITVTDANGCQSQEKNMQIRVTGPRINNEDANYTALAGLSSFEIFPNPTNDFITIEAKFDNQVNLEIKLTNLIGEDIYYDSVKETDIYIRQIDLSSFSSGFYFLQITEGGNYLIEKVVKE